MDLVITRYFATTHQLTALNEEAVGNSYHMAIADQALQRLDPNGSHSLEPTTRFRRHVPIVRCLVRMQIGGHQEPVMLDCDPQTLSLLRGISFSPQMMTLGP